MLHPKKKTQKITRETFEATLIMMGWIKRKHKYTSSIEFINLDKTAKIQIQNAINTASLNRDSHYRTCRAAYYKILSIIQNE